MNRWSWMGPGVGLATLAAPWLSPANPGLLWMTLPGKA